MQVNFQPTQLDGKTEKFTYRVRLDPERNGWFLQRWPNGAAILPPGEFLTTNGWEKLSTNLQTKTPLKFINFDDVNQYIEE